MIITYYFHTVSLVNKTILQAFPRNRMCNSYSGNKIQPKGLIITNFNYHQVFILNCIRKTPRENTKKFL